MRTADFKGELTPNGHIAVPHEIASQVPPGEQIQVALQWGGSGEDTDWRAMGGDSARRHTLPATRSMNC